jgi:hypothetical protein
MTDRLDFETRLEARLRARANIASRPFDAVAIAQQAVGAVAPRRRIGLRSWPSLTPALGWLIAGLLLAIAILGAVSVAGALLRKAPVVPLGVVSNGWIAYSTAPHVTSGDGTRWSSALYLVRGGVPPRLIASDDAGATQNVCPVFSPDGAKLAFGVNGGGRAVVLLALDGNGVAKDSVRIDVPGTGPGPCVRWSADGTRVGYYDGGQIVVRGLDGSTQTSIAGDPGPADFLAGVTSTGAIISPDGGRIAWLNASCQLNVARRDGTAAQVIPIAFCPYAVSTWSPDGQQVLLMQDVDGGFAIREMAVDSPFDTVLIESYAPVLNARAWPAFGDVSWQPVFP